MSAERVYQVQYIARVEGEEVYRQAISPLIFRAGLPFVVLAWGGTEDNAFPLLSRQLDPARLTEHPGGDADYLYDGLIEVPPQEPETPD